MDILRELELQQFRVHLRLRELEMVDLGRIQEHVVSAASPESISFPYESLPGSMRRITIYDQTCV